MEKTTGIYVEDVTFWRDGSESDVQQWSLHIEKLDLKKGTIYSVLGDNMVGKSTLLRILSGLEKVHLSDGGPAQGKIRARLNTDRPEQRERLDLAARYISLLAHDDTMFPELSIWDNVRIARGFGSNRDTVLAKRTFIEILRGSSMLRSRSESELLGRLSSGGKALIKLARACCWSVNIILIDEVTAHLDHANAQSFFSILGRFIAKDATLVLVSHATRDHELASTLAGELGMPYSSIQIQRRNDGACFIGR